MATTATFDYHWDGYLVLDETPTGTDLGTMDWHWDGQVGVPEEATAGGKLFRHAGSLNGLGGGGPFFKDPLAA